MNRICCSIGLGASGVTYNRKIALAAQADSSWMSQSELDAWIKAAKISIDRMAESSDFYINKNSGNIV